MTKQNSVRTLYHGDNLRVLKGIPESSVDLVIMDPPFEISAKMKYTPKDLDGIEPGDFFDLWRRKKGIPQDIRQKLVKAIPDLQRLFLCYTKSHSPAMRKFQEFQAVRLMEIIRVLKPGASLYAQSRSRGSHYTKMMMDVLLGARNFQNEIVWIHPSSYRAAEPQMLEETHETILHYVKGKDQYGIPKEVQGLPDREGDLGNTWRVSESFQREMRTDTPMEIYERMIERSSLAGDLVLDPFCGRGWSLLAAERLGRRWIGIDEWAGAKRELRKRMGKVEFEVMGEDRSL